MRTRLRSWLESLVAWWRKDLAKVITIGRRKRLRSRHVIILTRLLSLVFIGRRMIPFCNRRMKKEDRNSPFGLRKMRS